MLQITIQIQTSVSADAVIARDSYLEIPQEYSFTSISEITNLVIYVWNLLHRQLIAYFAGWKDQVLIWPMLAQNL